MSGPQMQIDEYAGFQWGLRQGGRLTGLEQTLRSPDFPRVHAVDENSCGSASLQQ